MFIFSGGVSVAGAQPGLWAVHGGNKQIAEGILHISGAKLIKQKVENVMLKMNDSYLIKSTDEEGNVYSKNYDIVIVSTPLDTNLSRIQFDGITLPSFGESYHKTVAMFIQGLLDYEHFGYSSAQDMPENILTTDPNSVWSSIGFQMPIEVTSEFVAGDNIPIYKIFTQRTLSDEELSVLFKEFKVVHFADWLAYPHYSSIQLDIPEFELHSNLYYTNAIEWCASAMEMIAVSSRNVALLAFNKWNNIETKVDVENKVLVKLEKQYSQSEEL